jgi:serine/threonine-protein phosphatase 4 regulatory subunit 1
MEDDDPDISLSVSPAERILAFQKTDPEFRLVHYVHCAVSALSSCNPAFLSERILPLLKSLSESLNFNVLDCLLSALPHFGENLFDYFPDIAEAVLVNAVFPILGRMAEKVTPQLIVAVSESIAALVTILDPEDIVGTALPMLSRFVVSQRPETRSVTAEIIAALVDFLDVDAYAGQIVQIVDALASDEHPSVRCMVPPLIADYVRRFENSHSKVQLSEQFSLLVLDGSLQVRITAAESLLKLAEGLDAQSKVVTVMPALRLFLEDSREEVRDAALKDLGALMAQFGSSADAGLVTKYCSLLAAGDSDMAYSAAFSFPAVALALGKARWNEIKPAFDITVASQNHLVRRTLAFGLVSFAPLMEELELRRMLLDYLNDISEVAVGVLTNLYQIIRYIENKAEVLECLVGLLQKNPSWRIRLRVSEQLRYCSEDFDHAVLRDSAKLLLRDQVATVRNDAILSFVCLMTKEDISFVEKLVESRYFVDRIVAAAMVGYFPDEVLPQAVPLLIALCADAVPNVRVSAARSLRSLGDRVPSYREEIAVTQERLKRDPDADVREFIG